MAVLPKSPGTSSFWRSSAVLKRISVEEAGQGNKQQRERFTRSPCSFQALGPPARAWRTRLSMCFRMPPRRSPRPIRSGASRPPCRPSLAQPRAHHWGPGPTEPSGLELHSFSRCHAKAVGNDGCGMERSPHARYGEDNVSHLGLGGGCLHRSCPLSGLQLLASAREDETHCSVEEAEGEGSQEWYRSRWA